jgi:hypothetical protein
MKPLFALLVASSLWAQAPAPNKAIPQQGPPPKNLSVRPDGHVSANQDPADPGKFEVRIVKMGETLSGIAGEVLKNPRLWPQLWEQNDHIINPHWIYPNDQILIRPVTVLSEVKPPEPEPAPEPPPAPEPAPEPRRPVQRAPRGDAEQQQLAAAARPVLVLDEQKPVPQIKFDDLYCSGFVRTAPVADDLKVISKFDSSGAILSTDGEYVYLSHGSEDGIASGMTYQVVRPTKTLNNPFARTRSQRDLGMHYLDVAQLRVVLVQPEFSLARVIHTCGDAVDIGDILMPFKPISLPTPSRGRVFSPMMRTTSGISGMIVGTKDVRLNFGSTFVTSGITPGIHGTHLGYVQRGLATEGSIVYIDIGPNSSVQPGDVFIVYRHVDVDSPVYDFPKETDKLRATRTAIGEMIVVKVGERAATAVVTYSTDALALGDIVERR